MKVDDWKRLSCGLATRIKDHCDVEEEMEVPKMGLIELLRADVKKPPAQYSIFPCFHLRGPLSG